MVFSSFVFLLIFLPLTLLFYYLCPKKGRNIVLLLASLLFYAWGEPVYVWIMVGATWVNYISGRLIGSSRRKKRLHRARAFFIIDIIANLSVLGLFKYTDFALETWNSISGMSVPLLKLALPVGISFYTFQNLSYIIDVYNGVVVEQRNLLKFATYVTLFPQLIAGPIVQYKTIEAELGDRTVTLSDFQEGAFRFTLGLSKKVLLANQIGELWNQVLEQQHSSVTLAWLGAVAFSFQIYFDFSGYSDMAIGLGRMFGFHFQENFNRPYVAKSITDFWKRWHISLSTWFREYVYIPLGGNRKGRGRQILNLILVWALTGLWHGASWNFLLWGGYYCLILILEKQFLLKGLKRLPAWLQHVYSLLLIMIGWVIFAQKDWGALVTYLGQMFGVGVPLWNTEALFLLRNYLVLLAILVVGTIDWKPLVLYLAEWKQPKRETVEIGKTILMVALLLLCFSFLAADGYNPFLYFEF